MKGVKFYGEKTSCRYRGLIVIIPCLMFCLLWSETQGDSLCEGCLNGGKLLMPNNIFGYCRCKCYGDYKGPKCQFIYKRTSPTKYLSAAVEEAIAKHGKTGRWPGTGSGGSRGGSGGGGVTSDSAETTTLNQERLKDLLNKLSYYFIQHGNSQELIPY